MIARATLAALLLGAGPALASEPEAVTFDEAVARARAHAVGSVVAAEEIRRAEGLLEQSRAGSLPSIGVNGTWNRLDAPRRSASGALVTPGEQLGANAQAALVLSPARWYQWSHAGDQLDVSKAGAADAQRNAALLAGRAYLAVIGQKRVLDVSRRAVESAQAHYDFAHARREAGVGNALDELRAEQQLATATAQLEAVLTGLARSQEALGQACGGDAPLDARVDPVLATPASDASDKVAARRADVQAAGARAQAASRVRSDSWADWLPQLLGTFTAFRQDWSTASAPQSGWQAQAILSFPIFEGGFRAGQYRERSALDAEAQAQLDGLLRVSRSEVRAAWASLQHAEASLVESRRAADRAARVLALVDQAYTAGSANSLDVNDAQQQARNAETVAAVIEDAVRQARLDLLAATGNFP